MKIKSPKRTLLLSLIFLFLFGGSVYGDNPEARRSYWDNGKLKVETHYLNGKKQGSASLWYENGNKKAETLFNNDKKEGLATTWYESGEKWGEQHYKNGIPSGLVTLWFKNGNKKTETNYKDGKPNGLMTQWYESGTKERESYNKNGKMDGLVTQWYPSGEKQGEMHYKDGKEHGKVTLWYESGSKKGEGSFENGKQVYEKHFKDKERSQDNLGLLKKEPENNKGSQSNSSNAEEPKDDVWVAEQMSVGVIASVNGLVTRGDRFRIRIEKNKCQQGERWFSFYTTEGNKDILKLEGKTVEIKLNNKIINAEFLTAQKFIMGYSAIFHLGFEPIDSIISSYKDKQTISVELFDSVSFKASNYFDVLQNDWSLENLGSSLKEAQALCKSNNDLLEKTKKDEYQKWLELAENGDSEAQIKVGTMFVAGFGVDQDYEKAIKWYRRSAEQKNAKAQYYSGLLFENTLETPEYYNDLIKWYQLSAEQGEKKAKAREDLEGLYNKHNGSRRDVKEAVKWYRLAAKQGHAKAQYRLGMVYDNGVEVAKDYNEAFKWFKLAAEQEIPEAQFELGILYAMGRGAQQDKDEAIKWWKLAAEQGHEQAQVNLDSALQTLAKGSPIDCREDAKEVPHKYEDSCIYEAGAGKVITIDMRIKESHGDEEIIDIPYSNLRHAGAIIQIYYTVGVWGKAQWFPISSMKGVVVMNNSLMLPIGKWVKQGLLPGTFIRVVIFKSE